MKRLSKAIYLKSSDRMSEKAKAQSIFIEIISVTGSYLSKGIVTSALLNLIELLIVEFKISKNQTVYGEIQQYLERLLNIVHNEHLYGTWIDALILQTKLHIVEGNFDEASKVIEQAYQAAETKGLTGILDKINFERKKMEDNVKEIKRIVKTSNIVDRFDKVELLDYIQKAQKTIINE